jgi:hypothetical protein
VKDHPVITRLVQVRWVHLAGLAAGWGGWPSGWLGRRLAWRLLGYLAWPGCCPAAAGARPAPSRPPAFPRRPACLSPPTCLPSPPALQLRTYLEKVRPIDKQLHYQIEKLLRATAAAQAEGGEGGADDAPAAGALLRGPLGCSCCCWGAARLRPRLAPQLPRCTRARAPAARPHCPPNPLHRHLPTSSPAAQPRTRTCCALAPSPLPSCQRQARQQQRRRQQPHRATGRRRRRRAGSTARPSSTQSAWTAPGQRCPGPLRCSGADRSGRLLPAWELRAGGRAPGAWQRRLLAACCRGPALPRTTPPPPLH